MTLYGAVGASVLFLALVVPTCKSFVQKNETVCQSASDCTGLARLTCNNTGQRLAVLGVSLAHHLNISMFDHCGSPQQNCSDIQETCCHAAQDLSVCQESYPIQFLENVFANCSAQLPSPSAQDNNNTTTTNNNGTDGCVVELPSGPQPSVDICARLSSYRTTSSYSVVDYACIPDSDVAPLCESATRRGNLLYALWTPTQSQSSPIDVNATSCRCSVTTVGTPTDFFVRPLDVRIPQSTGTGECSSVYITDRVRPRLDTDCSKPTSILFGDTSQFPGVTSRPPVDVILTVNPQSEPAIVWIGFQGLDSQELILTCFEAGMNLTRNAPDTYVPTDDGGDSLPVAGVIAGVVGAVVVLVIIAFILFHLLNRSKKRATLNKGDDWWERTREEDRLAELSQLGPASYVNVDTGRNMGYGRHPPTRRSYKTSDTNPPIRIIPGNAVPRAPNDLRRSSQNGHPAASSVGGGAPPPVPSNEAAGVWSMGEPSVTYTNVPQQDGEGGQQPVAIVNDGYKVRVYEVPPLTIKEIE